MKPICRAASFSIATQKKTRIKPRAAFERAVEFDPSFALAWAGLGADARVGLQLCHVREAQKGFDAHLAAAREAVERALCIRTRLAGGTATLARDDRNQFRL